ncbi:MAG: hypothetical protein E7271_08535 [Lachnospiraceae bacterium]|nr:hypothetical protein [Lachnospiraceae bacterium]
MANLFDNVISGARAGGIIGAAIDGLFITGATIVAGPVGFAEATELVISKEAIGTLTGAGAGVVKTIIENKL